MMMKTAGNERLLVKPVSGKAIALAGPNFSGRTRILRLATGLSESGDEDCIDSSVDSPRVYIGPEVYNALSGLAPTVRTELQLHSSDFLDSSHLRGVLERSGIIGLLNRSPFTLSGGEQSCLVVATAAALDPSVLAIDCALEQLDHDLKVWLLHWLQNSGGERTATLLADNRLGEYPHHLEVVETGNASISDSTCSSRRAQRFGRIDPGVALSFSSSSQSQIVLKDLTFAYTPGKTILSNASVTLNSGHIYFLSGRNGSGKSTLAKILCGVLRPKSGQMRLGDAEFRPWTRPGRAVGYHFQNPDLQLFSTTVESELLTGAVAAKRSRADCARRTEALLAMFGLQELRRAHPLDLPFVIRKRVAIAATLAGGTPWLVIDEPTLGQDDSSSEAIAAICRNLVDLGAGIVIISHSQHFQSLLPGHRILLHDGALSLCEEEP